MSTQSVVVFDLASLRFHRGPGGLTLLSQGRVELAHARIETPVLREAAAQILTHAAATGRVWRGGHACRIGLYHPETGEVSLGASPHLVTVRGDGPLALEPEGSLGTWDGDVLEVAGARLHRVELGFTELLGRLLAS